uniref:DUF370 domain-containing protein n=1 Tax=uncultured Bacillota bacterium TaxID=344338 RepID=A0A650EMZ6_9FIRM|nr:hypothetical protein Firmicute1046_3030 [uncultured Firmicutes bacterium]
MYLHLGSDTVVNTKNIISILDLESTSVSKYSKEFFKIVEEEGFVKNVSVEIPKTIVVCEIDGQSVVYITNISSKALAGRVKTIKGYSETEKK